jgi:hypothetical protein
MPATVRRAVVRWVVVNAAAIAIWLASGNGLHDFWPKWVLVVSTVGLLVRTVGGGGRPVHVQADPPPDIPPNRL